MCAHVELGLPRFNDCCLAELPRKNMNKREKQNEKKITHGQSHHLKQSPTRQLRYKNRIQVESTLKHLICSMVRKTKWPTSKLSQPPPLFLKRNILNNSTPLQASVCPSDILRILAVLGEKVVFFAFQMTGRLAEAKNTARTINYDKNRKGFEGIVNVQSPYYKITN